MKAVFRVSCWFAFFLLVASSCLDEPDCFALNNNLVGVSFKKLSDGRADTIVVSSITAAGTDSVFLTNALLTGITLPINYLSDETAFAFTRVLGDETIVRELVMTYDVQPQFVSEACGERFFFTGLNAVSGSFDSIRVVSSTPGRTGGLGTNIEIYRCPNRQTAKLRFAEPVEIATLELVGGALYNLAGSGALQTLTVPLDPNNDQSTIRFTFADGTNELVLSYARQDTTFFSTCGEQIVFSDLQIVSSDFANAPVLADTSFQDPPRTNIAITR